MQANPIGDLIAKHRQDADLTQEEFAAKIEKSPRVVQYYEAGNTVPSYDTLFNICLALNIEPNVLIAPMFKHWKANRK